MTDTLVNRLDGHAPEASEDLEEIITRFRGVSVLVVGDLVLDQYTVGRPTRISREAPIAVLEFSREYVLPGGGANPACTIASLGAQANLGGVIGEDEWGRQLLAALSKYGVRTQAVVNDASRPTICKRRVVAQVTPTMLQQVARIDHVDRTPISGNVEEQLIEAIEAELPQSDAVLLSNYRSGTLTANLVGHICEVAGRSGKLVSVDSQGDLDLFRGCGIVKCNQPEAEEALRKPLQTDEDFESGMSELIARLDARAVIVTRGAQGMSVMSREGDYRHIPVTNTSEVNDVTGAGDTVIALVTLATAAGANLFDASRLANYGAGVVVRRWGNAVLKQDELKAALHQE